MYEAAGFAVVSRAPDTCVVRLDLGAA
jgi:hypothetical protein